MISDKLVAYIHKEKDRGFTKKQIRKILLEVGYTKIDVKQAFEHITKIDLEKPTKTTIKNTIMRLFKTLLITIMIGSLMASIFFGATYLQKKTNILKEINDIIKGSAKIDNTQKLTASDLIYIEKSKKECENNPEYTKCLIRTNQRKNTCKNKIIDCLDEVYKEVFVKTKDSTLCEQMSTTINKDNCFLEMSQHTKNKAYCDKTTLRDIKYNCIKAFQ